DFRGVLRRRLHGSILSRVGASGKAGAVHSKNTLAVWVRPSGVNFIVCNSSEGHQALLLNLAEIQVERVLLEATGGYERAVMGCLAQAGHSVVRINPRRARAFAQAMGKLVKTDPVDAGVLAHLAQVIEP